MSEDQKPSASSAAAIPLQDRSDDMLGRVLGRNLMDATVRVVALLAAAGVVLATIATLAG